jgi:hypothetical protein
MALYLGGTRLDPVPSAPRYAASVAFAAPDNEVPIALPEGYVSMHVYAKHTDVQAAVSLQVRAAGGTAVTVSETGASPTDISGLAGGVVLFTVSGMDPAAGYAVFGVRMQ